MEIKDINTTGLSDKTKGILTGIVATAIISTGLVVGFNTKDTPKMTYDEAQKLIAIYNHELQKSQDKNFTGIKDDNVVQKLNEKLSARVVTKTENVDGENIAPDTYKILRSGLFSKAQ
jgi:predicted methyltransferase